jgi:hypothetical protein
VKKSDIDNFEYYLDTYLKIFKKFKNLKNKNQTLKSSAILNETKMNHRELLNLTTLSNFNSTILEKKNYQKINSKANNSLINANVTITNFTKAIGKLSSNLNLTSLSTNLTNPKRSGEYMTFINSITNTTNTSINTSTSSNNKLKTNSSREIEISKEKTKTKKHKQRQMQNLTIVNNLLKTNRTINHDTKINLTEKINSFLLGDTGQSANNSFATLEDQINFSLKSSKSSKSLKKKINKTRELKDNTTLEKCNTTNLNANDNKITHKSNNFKHHKFRILNQQTLVPVKTKTNNTSVIKSNNTSSNSNYFFDEKILENKIYKKLVNISISLIVIGLLMGIFVGLIVVMYFSSNSK